MASWLQQLIDQLCKETTNSLCERDESIIEYVVDGAAEVSIGDLDDHLADWDQVLCGGVPAWSELDEDSRTAALIGALVKVKEEEQQAEQAARSAAMSRAASTSTSMRAGTDDLENQEPSAECSCSDDFDEQSEQQLDLLAALVPDLGLSRPFLQHVLFNRFNGRAEDAASFLLDAEDLQALQEAWGQELLEQQRAAQEERALKAKQKQAVLAKFDLQEIKALKEPAKGKPLPAVHTWQPAKDEAKKPTVRYHEGQVVTTKGEKFIIEKDKEWDGGSRGRVKTKGKRGTGWA